MKYIISYQGDKVGVGLLDAYTAQEDINLAHNLFNTHVNNSYYNGVLNFPRIKSFYRFLIHKYIFEFLRLNNNYSQALKAASNRARSVINNEVKYENFLPQIYHHNEQTRGRVFKWHHPLDANKKL